MRRLFTIMLVFAFLLTSTAAFSQDGYERAEPSGAEIMLDIILIRPLGIVATAIGGVVFLVGLPFTLPTSSVKVSAEKLVADPFYYTFSRPVGDIDSEYTGTNR